MADNLRIWNALYKTDPKHTKPFSRAGGFRGTATKPIWLTKRLTEYFGPCGAGWGMDKPEFQTVSAGDEILVFCTVALWYNKNPALAPEANPSRATVYGVGGDKVMGKNKNGPFANDEAFKASYTDALSNAMKQIGVAADIHMGLFDDQKYVREVTQEFADADADIQRLAGKDAARDPETGELLSNYQVNKAKKAQQAVNLVKESAKLAIGMCQNRPELKEWIKANKAELAEKLEVVDYDAIIEAVDARWDDLAEPEKVA